MNVQDEIKEIQQYNFYKFEELASKLKSLNYIIQNDFSLFDDYSSGNLRLDMKEFNDNVKMFETEFKKLVNSTNNILSYYIEQKENEENEGN